MDKMYVDLYKSARQTCEACQVKPGEKVVIYTDTMKNPTLIDAFFTACVARGAQTVLVKAEARPPMVEPPPTAVDAMIAADMVFDLATDSWLFTQATHRIIGAGTRMLQVLVSDEAVIARPPVPSVRERVEAAYQLYKDCKDVRITSPAGMDFTFRRGDREVIPQAGCVFTPGDWDSLGLAMVNIYPPETEAKGMLVFDGSLYLIPNHKILLKNPVRARVEKGRIVEIEANHEEAKLLDGWFRSWNDPQSYVIAHVGFGVDPRADIYSYDIGAWESANAGVVMGIGSNISVESTGVNESVSHMDACFFNASFYIDGKPIIENGKFVVPELMD